MSVVSLLGIKVMNNPAKFTDPYHFVITFECLEPLEEDFECKLTYVGSANSDRWDQELEANSVGPIPTGVHNFEFKPPAPDLKKLHEPDILGVTVILLTCSYKGREFVRVGYYVNNEYDSEELINAPPAKVNIDRVKRNILSEKPRVTRFAIKWDSEASAPAEYPPEQPEAEIVADGDQYGAEEEAEEAELEKQAAAEEGDDSEMAGVENENSEAKAQNGQTDEGNLSDKGSVDLEGESSEDEFEEEEEEGAEDVSKAQGGDDAMDVDMADSKPAGAQANNPVSVAI